MGVDLLLKEGAGEGILTDMSLTKRLLGDGSRHRWA